MKKATRLIIEEGNNIIFIKRTKIINGSVKSYYVLPGGHLDGDESWEEAGIREAMEELSVEIKLDELMEEMYNEELDKLERFYFAHITKGKIKQGSGEEFENMSLDSKHGLYEIARLIKKEISAYTILPVHIKDRLIATYV